MQHNNEKKNQFRQFFNVLKILIRNLMHINYLIFLKTFKECKEKVAQTIFYAHTNYIICIFFLIKISILCHVIFSRNYYYRIIIRFNLQSLLR